MRIMDWSSDVCSSDLDLYVFSGAGNDVLTGDHFDGAEGGLPQTSLAAVPADTYYGDDIIVGDALATGAGGTATANNEASVTGSSDAFVWAEAGSDSIDGGEGRNLLVGDAATTDENGGHATAHNEASVDGAAGSAGAGTDDIEWDADNVFS